MTEDTKQAVVDETKASATPDVKVDDARGDVDQLDQLLAQWDQETKPAATVSPPEKQTIQPDNELASEVQNLKAIASEWQKEKDRKAMSDTIAEIRGEVPAEVFDDDMVEGWLNALAVKDPRLAQAYMHRDRNPREWGRVKAELGKKLAGKVGKLPDKAATEDREAVAAAIRGASTRQAPADPPPNLGSLSDAEFNKFKSDLGI